MDEWSMMEGTIMSSLLLYLSSAAFLFPTQVVGSRKAAIPSSEFIESFLICLYGASNVWLEHLNAWGEAWSPMDYEHVSITILFFGGGLVRL